MGRIGRAVDYVTGANVCMVAAMHECEPGLRSSEPGGFHYPIGVAIDEDPASPHYGHLYVSDEINQRIQEFMRDGAFVAMFGWDVNATKTAQATATHAERSVCTQAEVERLKVRCTNGKMGPNAGQLNYPASIAVDPGSGNIYVEELSPHDFRVDKYTPDGHFEWMVGKNVNKTTGRNLCTRREIETQDARCGYGAKSSVGSKEPGAFKFGQTYGNLLAAGGPEDLVYVGDEQRIQEFTHDGKWVRDISLASISDEPFSNVVAIAIGAKGDIYAIYQTTKSQPDGSRIAQSNTIRRLDPYGHVTLQFAVHTGRQPKAIVTLNSLAIDRHGHIATTGAGNVENGPMLFGALYDAGTGRRLSEFPVEIGNDSLAFDGHDELYVGATDGEDVLIYGPTERHY